MYTQVDTVSDDSDPVLESTPRAVPTKALMMGRLKSPPPSLHRGPSQLIRNVRHMCAQKQVLFGRAL